jgi:integrase
VQVALTVELLLMTALRRANIAGLHLDQHLRWTRTPRATTVHLVLDGHEVKTGQDLAFQLPAETIDLLDIYLHDYRPVLTGPDNRFLFPGRGTGPKAAHRLGEQVRDHVYTQTGIRGANMHVYRHIAVKLMLDTSPTNYESPRQLLGHGSTATTMQYYAEHTRSSHIRRYDDLILTERQRAITLPPGPRQRPRPTSASRRRSESPA